MGVIHWLLVGAGDIARKRVAPALAGAEGSRLAGICTRRPETARDFAEHYQAPVYGDLAEALAGCPAQAVYVATPVDLHVPQALQALQAGKHVLVEKPLARSGAEGDELVRAAEASGLTVACAYYRRLSARYRHAQAALRAGQLGRLRLARLVYHANFDPGPDDPKHWRVVRARSGGGPLADMGSHMFDSLISLTGMPVSVQAQCSRQVRNWDVEDTAAVLMTLPDGALVSGSFSWCSGVWRHEQELVGSEGGLAWGPYDSGPVLQYGRGAQPQALDLPPAENVHLSLVNDFVEAVLTGRPPACPAAEAVLANRLMDAIFQAAAEGREVKLAGLEAR